MSRDTITSSRGIGKNCIRGNGLIEARNVGSRKPRSEVTTHRVARLGTIPLCGILQCIPYTVDIHTSKIRTQGLKIRILGRDRFRAPVGYCRVWREVIVRLEDASQINVREALVHIYLKIKRINSFLVFLVQESRYVTGIL
jgi:hypothetical protein